MTQKIGAYAKNNYFIEATKNGIMTSKDFWNTFLTNKGKITGNAIIL